MKKLVIFIFIIASAKVPMAQVSLGAKADINISNILLTSPNRNVDKFKAIIGFNASLLSSIRLHGHFYLQPEIMISQQGGSLNGVNENYNYINIPILFKYQFTNGFFTEAGMQAGIIFSSNQPLVRHDNKIQKSPDDGSWIVGAGYKISKINLGIDIRYNLSIIPYYTVNGESTYGKNSVFQFGIFYLFAKL